MRRGLALGSLLLAVCLPPATAAAATTRTLEKRERKQLATLHRYQGTLAFFEKRPRLARTREGRAAVWRAGVWLRVTRRELAETRAARRPKRSTQSSSGWLWDAFLCIHRHEGAWNANTGNGYYGGLQMDHSFMSSYGPELLAAKGPASNWTPAEQIAVAIRAYHSGRGFGPWPSTRRMCGL